MSLILEALKKSERERRLGETPSLGSPVMAVRRAPSRLPWLIGLVVAALAVGLWLRREPPAETPGPSATSVVADEESPQVNAPAASMPPATTDAPPERVRGTADTRMPRSKVAVDPTAAMPPDMREKVKSGEIVVANPNLLIPGQPSTIKESEPITPAAPDAAAKSAAPALESWPTAAARAAVPATPPAPAAAPPTVATAPVVTPTAPAVAAPSSVAAAPAAPAPATANVVKLLWELPYAQRREIPDLKVTMHVFDATPAARFIIVNGNRQVEGDDIEGIKVIEIRPDGVVMESQGQRFLYPRGGR